MPVAYGEFHLARCVGAWAFLMGQAECFPQGASELAVPLFICHRTLLRSLRKPKMGGEEVWEWRFGTEVLLAFYFVYF